jgi:ArsR family transcriptional regulator, lead/cadmium/zinc/bismuth-responsive transcriptional repressor
MVATCGEQVIHPRAVREAQRSLPGAGELQSMGDYFKTLGDPTRLKILYSLAKGELCVCDIVAVLGLSISAISHQLAVLKRQRLVKFRRDGKIVYYSLSDDHVESILQSIHAHTTE